MTLQNKGFGEMPSARLDSRRNSVQNGVVESFPALTGTIFVNFFDFCIFRKALGPKNYGQNQQAHLKKPPKATKIIKKSAEHTEKILFKIRGLAKCRRRGWIRTEILCRMAWSRASQLSRGQFS